MTPSVWAFLVVLTALRLIVAGLTPLAPDEAYYWVWSRALAPGYLDHPPMVALWIRAGTWLLGPTPLGVRLLAPLSGLLGSILLASAGRDLLGLDRVGAGRAAILLNATLMIGAGTVTMTPDTPLIFFWTAALAALGRALRPDRTGAPGGPALALAGLATGLAFCSKYTGFLLVIAIGAWLLAFRAARPWLRDPRAWGAAALALATTLPVVAWNAAHGFASFAKQGGRNADIHPARAARYLTELVLGQFGLATPLIAVLACAGTVALIRRARRGEPGAGLLAFVTVLPAAVFLIHAAGDRVQANWPCVLYPGAALGASAIRMRLIPARAASALGFAITAFVYLQAATGLLALPPRLDVTLARLGGWDTLAARLAIFERVFRLPLVADDYALASELAWHRAAPRVEGIEPRWTLFALPHPDTASRARSSVLLLRSARRTDPPDPRLFTMAVRVGNLDRVRSGRRAERYDVFVAAIRAGAPCAVLPQPGGPPPAGPSAPAR